MVVANRFRNNDLVLVPEWKIRRRVADICRQFCNVKQLKYDWGRPTSRLEQQLERGCYEAFSFATAKQQRHHPGR